jgi:hypothetical protein
VKTPQLFDFFRSKLPQKEKEAWVSSFTCDNEDPARDVPLIDLRPSFLGNISARVQLMDGYGYVTSCFDGRICSGEDMHVTCTINGGEKVKDCF